MNTQHLTPRAPEARCFWCSRGQSVCRCTQFIPVCEHCKGSGVRVFVRAGSSMPCTPCNGRGRGQAVSL